MKILIIQQKMIGDVLASSILFETLKGKYPDYELHYIINTHTFPVVKGNPFIDKFIFITPEIEHSKLKFYSFLKKIKQEKYDVVIDVYSKFSSNLITLFSGATTKISKYKWYTSFIYSKTFKEKKVTVTNASLVIENRLQLLHPIYNGIPPIIQPKVYLTDAEIKASKALLIKSNIDLSKPLFMISAIGRAKNKTYPLPYMAKIVDAIVKETKGQILFNYIPKQKPKAKALYKLCKEETRQHIKMNIFGENLRKFLAITKHCNALIGNEGGSINMAKALNVSTFTIFSPWIIKAAWNMFEDGKTNVSIHLKDVKPELYQGKSYKETKRASLSLYKLFPPKTIIPNLKWYLQHL